MEINEQQAMEEWHTAEFDVSPLDAVYTEYIAAFEHWINLYQEPECLHDIDKHRAMTQARIRYQDAKLNYVFTQRLITAKVISECTASPPAP
ncbi:MAG: hypothetical protein ACRYFS_21940 [Janthinobacterium lividum]